MNLKKIVQSNVSNFQESVENTVKSTATNFANSALENVLGGGAAGILKSLLKGPSSIPPTGEKTQATDGAKTNDWRVRLSIPPNMVDGNEMFKPLVETNGLVFPYTPTILVQHTANYDAMHPTHSNYPFPQYQNSQIEDIVITGDFFVENAKEAQYWVAMTHFLRSVTKMDYGLGQNSGAPPPLIFLNGYGDFVFPNVPVVVRNFTFDLPSDVDYIKTQASGEISTGPTTGDPKGKAGFVPTQSQVSITVAPVYSRAKTSQFNLDKFVKGDYLGTNGNNGGGFI